MIHLDEATPHLHVDFVPFATEQSRGLSTRNSLSKALEQQGFSAKTNLETPAKQWTDFEKQQLAEVMLKRGIEWEQLGTHNEHLSVLDFKKQEREKEVAHWESEVKGKELILEWQQQVVAEAEAVIDRIDTDYQVKTAAIEQLNAELSEKENIKAQTEAVLTEKQALLNENLQKVSKINSIDHIETGKTVFDGKITVAKDDYEKLTNLAKKQIATESKEGELTAEVTKLKKENEELSSENSTLRENVRAARSLQNSFSALQRELET